MSKDFVTKEQCLQFLAENEIHTRDGYKAWRRDAPEEEKEGLPANPADIYDEWTWTLPGPGPAQPALSERVTVTKDFVSREEMHEQLVTEGIESKDEYLNWRDEMPEEEISHLPADPYYQYEHWSWNPVGEIKRWGENSMRWLLEQIGEDLQNLPAEEIYAIFQSIGDDRPAELLQSVTGESLGTALRMLSEDPEMVLDMFGGGGEPAPSTTNPDSASASDLDALAENDQVDAKSRAIRHIVRRRVNRCWERLEAGEDPLDPLGDGPVSDRIRDQFREEQAGTLQLWQGLDWDYPYPPNMMQRRAAYLLSERDGLVNFSDVGTGKTLSGVLCAKATDAELTVIVSPAAVRDQWASDIREAHADVTVCRELPDEIEGPTYLLLSYYELSMEERERALYGVLAAEPDLIVFDEVQNAKQRQATHKSNRREAAEMLTERCDAKVLALSALPVINNVREGKRLLGLVGTDHADIPERNNVDGAIALSRHLHDAGIRHTKDVDAEVNLKLPEKRASWSPEYVLRQAEKGILQMEWLHAAKRLSAALGYVSEGTIIYTHYVSEIVDETVERLEKAGHDVGVYTGDRKGGLKRFATHDADVLVASQPISEGLEGLQTRADTLVFLSLPWTSARFDQTVGRLARSGFEGEEITVVVPQVRLEDGWSWCEARWEFLESKRMLVDTVMSGQFPDDIDYNRSQILSEVKSRLKQSADAVPVT